MFIYTYIYIYVYAIKPIIEVIASPCSPIHNHIALSFTHQFTITSK